MPHQTGSVIGASVIHLRKHPYFISSPLQGLYMWLPTATDAAVQRHQHAADGYIRLPCSARHRDTLRLVRIHTGVDHVTITY